ncbi:hypothetical protein [Natrialba taiwanensis]|uniref:hypothetical protein n=1 Tax=Natrialba taiwanensis TaxID=160846 RepID=UPI0014615F4F|nr:hypothetical protein [Natrialba taiwanensis]
MDLLLELEIVEYRDLGVESGTSLKTASIPALSLAWFTHIPGIALVKDIVGESENSSNDFSQGFSSGLA